MRTTVWLMLVCANAVNPEAGESAEAETGLPPQLAQQAVAPTADTPYRVISKPELKYPNEAREAIIYVRFLVSTEGIPVQVEVDESRGFYDDTFKAEALRFVQGIRLEPATHDGKPVEAGPVTQAIHFKFDGEAPPEQQFVSDEFQRQLQKVENLMSKRDYAGANFHAEWMLREKVQTNFEFAVLQAQLAQTHVVAGHVEEALKAATAATSRKGVETAGYKLRQPVPKNDPLKYLLPKDLILYLLDLRMRLEAQTGAVVAALKTYNELAGLTKIKPKDKSAVLADKLVAVLESGRPLGFGGKVVKEYWSHEQFHPSFTIMNVKGKVNLFHAHCRGGFHQYAYVENGTWTLPPDADTCVVEVYGDPGTTFNFVEVPAGATMPGTTPQ